MGRGGEEFDAEKAIATGYHAIEFLLWGQDRNETGAGMRSYEDYSRLPNADRRALYLSTVREPLADPDPRRLPGVQVVLPLRHHLYGGSVLWHEQGFRWAWHVMLVEKAGYVVFNVRDPATAREWTVYPSEYLTSRQQKMMSTQPDLILQLAHHIAADFRRRGVAEPEVRADAWVAANGRPSERLIDPTVDLAREEDGLLPKPWILSSTRRTAVARRAPS